MENQSRFRTLIVLDLETTGLIYDEPKITELAMIAVNIETLIGMKAEEELPRVLNKFVKFCDPVKLLGTEVVELTGLNNRMLMDCAPFNRDTVIAVEAFLSDLQKPICFVVSRLLIQLNQYLFNDELFCCMNLHFIVLNSRSHNGNRFDFPILLAEIQTALSVPSFYANADHGEQCVDDVPSLISTNADGNDDHSSTVSKAKDCATQTIIALEDYDRTSLTSIACADSLVFFRKQYQSLREKETTSQPNPNSLSSSSTKPTEDANDENLKINASVCVSPPSEPVCMPVKYVPSTDPARQQPSMKLVKIYEREFAQSTLHLNAHRAEDDCLMLLAILKRHLAEWLEWMEHNHQPLGHFSSLQSNSTPGKSPAKNVPVNL